MPASNLAGFTGMKIAKIELGNGVSFAIDAEQLPMTIGRAKDCDIRIREPSVSRLHCELQLRTGKKLWLQDLSSNGTMVNNRTVSGDSVLIEKRSSVSFASQQKLKITPTDDNGETLVPV